MLVTLALSGCTDESEEAFGRGGMVAAPESVDEESGEITDVDDADTDAGGGPDADDSAPGEAGRDDAGADRGEPAHEAGTVALSWTGGSEHQNFEYTAQHCYVGSDYVLVEGSGGPVGASGASTVKIFTTPAELLHEGTGTYQAEGSIQFTWGGGDIVADGRQIHVGDYPQPASFTYRQSGNSVKYVLAWFQGAADAGAGAVEVTCNHE